MISLEGRRRMRFVVIVAAAVVTSLAASGDEPDYLSKIKELGLLHLEGQIPAYYSAGPGHREHAQELQNAIGDMNAFYQDRLGVRTAVVLALLDTKDWTRVTGNDYGLPMVAGTPSVVFMPATPDSPAHALMMARRDAIPSETLQSFLKNQNSTFEAVADQFVDLIGFHELGHELTVNFGIDPKNRWLSEFLASYWSYAYISERRPRWKAVFDFLGRPSEVRPKNTSLEDFERLYGGVDDYGWYQGMFEARIRQIYPKERLTLLTNLKKEFPLTASAPGYVMPAADRMKPQVLLDKLDKIAPGFKEWGREFTSGS
jgi:hypothetical protein